MQCVDSWQRFRQLLRARVVPGAARRELEARTHFERQCAEREADEYAAFVGEDMLEPLPSDDESQETIYSEED
jgi:hypothetical protein